MIKDVKDLVDLGFAVHILGRKSKSPVEEKWSEAKVYSFKELEKQYFDGVTSGRGNVGVRLGEPSVVDGLYLHAIDLDIRDPSLESEAVKALKHVLRGYKLFKFWTVRSGSGGASRHYYFLTDRPFRTSNLARSADFIELDGRKRRAWEIDLLGTGKQAVLPPSIHPDTGKKYEWIIEPDDFPVVVDSDHIEDLLAEDDYEEIDNDDPLGMSWAEAEDMLEDLQDMADDHETWRDVGMALKHEFGEEGWQLFDDWSKKGRGYNKRDNRYQWDRFDNDRKRKITMRSVAMVAREQEARHIADEFDDGDVVRREVAKVEKKVAEERREQVERQRNDPDMTLLQDSLIAAPSFPSMLFGKKLAGLFNETAKIMSSPTDFIIGAFLVGASTCIGATRVVEIKHLFRQHLTLWVEAVGIPSIKKSPGISLVKRSLENIEKQYMQPYEQARKSWEDKCKAVDRARKVWDKMQAAKVAEGGAADDYPDDMQFPAEPPRRDMLIEDLTPEFFMRQQAKNPRGFAAFSDELDSWLGAMERYSNGSSRALWLKVYDSGSHTLGRVKDDGKVIRVERPYSPVVGGIQPDVLMKIVAETATDDGLQSRFLPFWPDYKFIPMLDDDTDLGDWMGPIFDNLASLNFDEKTGDPKVIKFSAKARKHFIDWSNKHRQEEAIEPTRLQSVFGKADGQVGRLATLFEYIWWANDSDDFDPKPEPKEVSLKAVEAAISMREGYIKPMQRRVYQKAIEPTELVNARVIAQWIVREGIDVINVRELRRSSGIKGLTGRYDADLVEAAINQLIAMKWVRIEEKDNKGRGRPKMNYVVNERVWELLK